MAVDLTGPQAVAESVLFGGVDACLIQREPNPSTTFDTATGAYTKPTPVDVYTGACSFRDQVATASGDSVDGAAQAVTQRWTVKLPLAAAIPQAGDIVTITAARDLQHVGRRLIVRDVGGGTFRVARSLVCERWEPGPAEDWLA